MESGHIVSLEPRASEWPLGGLTETLTCRTWLQRGSMPPRVSTVIWQGISRVHFGQVERSQTVKLAEA